MDLRSLVRRRASPRFMVLAAIAALLLTGVGIVAVNWATGGTGQQRDAVARDDAPDVGDDGYLDIDHDGTVEVKEFGHSVETLDDGVVYVMWAAIVENTSPEYEVEASFRMRPETSDGKDWDWTLRGSVPPTTTTGISDVTILEEDISVDDATLDVDDLDWTIAEQDELQVGAVEVEERSGERTRVAFEVESTFDEVVEPSVFVVFRDEEGTITAGSTTDDIAESSKTPPGESIQYVDVPSDRGLPADLDPGATEVYVSSTPVE